MRYFAIFYGKNKQNKTPTKEPENGFLVPVFVMELKKGLEPSTY